MAKVTNASARLITLDGVKLIPGVETEVADSAMQGSFVKVLLAGKMLTLGKSDDAELAEARAKELAERVAREQSVASGTPTKVVAAAAVSKSA